MTGKVKEEPIRVMPHELERLRRLSFSEKKGVNEYRKFLASHNIPRHWVA